MSETLLPADVEVDAMRELETRMPPLGMTGIAYGTKLQSGPRESVRLVSTGGATRDLVTDAHTLRIEAFAVSEGRAHRICAFAVAALQAAARDGRIGDSTAYRAAVFSLPQNLPHPNVPDRHRYVATLSLELRRTTA